MQVYEKLNISVEIFQILPCTGELSSATLSKPVDNIPTAHIK